MKHAKSKGVKYAYQMIYASNASQRMIGIISQEVPAKRIYKKTHIFILRAKKE